MRVESGNRSVAVSFEAAGPASASSSYIITATLMSGLGGQAAASPLPASPAPLVCKGCSVEFTGLVNDMGT